MLRKKCIRSLDFVWPLSVTVYHSLTCFYLQIFFKILISPHLFFLKSVRKLCTRFVILFFSPVDATAFMIPMYFIMTRIYCVNYTSIQIYMYCLFYLISFSEYFMRKNIRFEYCFQSVNSSHFHVYYYTYNKPLTPITEYLFQTSFHWVVSFYENIFVLSINSSSTLKFKYTSYQILNKCGIDFLDIFKRDDIPQ